MRARSAVLCPPVPGEAGLVNAAAYRTLAPGTRWRQAAISAAQHPPRSGTCRPRLSKRSAPKDLAERGGEDGPGVAGGGQVPPGDEPVRAHQDRAIAGRSAGWRSQAQRGSWQPPSRWPIRTASSGMSASAASCLAASHQAWPSSPAISRNRPGATRSLTGRRRPSSSSIQRAAAGHPGGWTADTRGCRRTARARCCSSRPGGPASQGRLTTASSASGARVPGPAGVC